MKINKKNLTIPGKSTITVDFDGVPCNYWRIANGGNTSLYCGVTTMPTPKFYDFKVAANATRMYAEENEKPRIYIYNSGTQEAQILLTYFRAEFDPTVMAICDFMDSDNESETVKVEIGGFTEPLPSGTNTIGKVIIDDSQANIRTQLISLQDLLQECNNRLEYDEQTTTSKEYKPATGYQYIKKIDFLTNDGETDILLRCLDWRNYTREIRIKPGETLSKFDYLMQNFRIYSGNSNTVTYRIVYRM